MKKLLKREKFELYYYEDSKKIIGIHKNLIGDVNGLTGNVSGLTGNVSGLTGDIDLCEITEEKRTAGIEINELILEE